MRTKPLALACALSVAMHVGAAFLVDGFDQKDRPEHRLRFSMVRQSGVHGTPRTVLAAPAAGPLPDAVASAQNNVALPASDAGFPSAPDAADPKHSEPDTAALDTFLNPDQLTSVPEPQGDIDLNLPEARLLSSPGTLVLKLWIDETGVVVHTELERSELPAAYSDAVVRVFGNALFAPGQVNGSPVNSILRIETRYE